MPARSTSAQKGFKAGTFAVPRAKAVAIAAENATLSDANYPLTDALNCTGLDSIFVAVEITGGTSPTANFEPLFRDEDAPDGEKWKRFPIGARDGVTPIASPAAEDTGLLTPGATVAELRVFGCSAVMLRVKATGGTVNTTIGWCVLAAPGRARLQNPNRNS